MKKRILFGIIAFLMLVPTLAFGELDCSVKSSCTSSETEIFRMYAKSDSHAELVIGLGGYTNKVCCSYPGKTLNVFTNSGEGRGGVIALSSGSDAHGSLISSTYPNKVYMGISGQSVSCDIKSTCSNDETCLASMFSNTDSHVGDCSYGNVKICCGVQAPALIDLELTEVLFRKFYLSDKLTKCIDSNFNLVYKITNVGNTEFNRHFWLCKTSGSPITDTNSCTMVDWLSSSPLQPGASREFSLGSTSKSECTNGYTARVLINPSFTDFSRNIFQSEVDYTNNEKSATLPGSDLCAGVSCDDDNACTNDGTCDPSSGDCPAKTTTSCDDNNPCTIDGTCNSITGCPEKENNPFGNCGINQQCIDKTCTEFCKPGFYDCDGLTGCESTTPCAECPDYCEYQAISDQYFEYLNQIPITDTQCGGGEINLCPNGCDRNRCADSCIEGNRCGKDRICKNGVCDCEDGRYNCDQNPDCESTSSCPCSQNTWNCDDNPDCESSTPCCNDICFFQGEGASPPWIVKTQGSYSEAINQCIYNNLIPCPEGCTNGECDSASCQPAVCTLGSTKCENSRSFECKQSSGECPKWEDVGECADVSCGTPCSPRGNSCTEDGNRQYCGPSDFCSDDHVQIFNCPDTGCKDGQCCTSDSFCLAEGPVCNGPLFSTTCNKVTDQGCLRAGASENCGALGCDITTGRCRIPCAGDDLCTTLGITKCESGKTYKCQSSGGCMRWQIEEDCGVKGCNPNNLVCNEECPSCTESCDGAKIFKCEDNDRDGCPEKQTTSVDCGPGSTCVNGVCTGCDTAGCETGTECSPFFDKKIIKGCSAGVCTQTDQNCPFGCDPATNDCRTKPPCIDECESGQKICASDTSFKECVKNECWEFSNTVTNCDSGEICSSGSCIANQPPEVDTVKIHPEKPTTEDNLECQYTPTLINDPDGHNPVDPKFRWEKDSTTITTATQPSLTGLSAGDSVKCGVIPVDLRGKQGAEKISEAVTILNPCIDIDKDGYGAGDNREACDNVKEDCKDNDININPGVSFDGCDNIDNNCDGVKDEDCEKGDSGSWEEKFVNEKPSVTISKPTPSEVITDAPYTFEFTGTDSDKDPLSYKIEYRKLHGDFVDLGTVGFIDKAEEKSDIQFDYNSKFKIKIPAGVKIVDARLDIFGKKDSSDKFPKEIKLKQGNTVLYEYDDVLADRVITLIDKAEGVDEKKSLKQHLVDNCANGCDLPFTIENTDGLVNVRNIIITYVNYKWDVKGTDNKLLPSGQYVLKITPFDQFVWGDELQVPFVIKRGCEGGSTDDTCNTETEDCGCEDCVGENAGCGTNKICSRNNELEDFNGDTKDLYSDFGCACIEGTTLCADGSCKKDCGDTTCKQGCLGNCISACGTDNQCKTACPNTGDVVSCVSKCNTQSCGIGANANDPSNPFHLTLNDGVCGLGEGCGCGDCDSRQDTCAQGLVCNERTKLCEICLHKLKGTVKDKDNNLLAYVKVTVTPGDYTPATTSSEGKFEFTIQSPGTYEVKVDDGEDNGIGSETVTFTALDCTTKEIKIKMPGCNDCSDCPETNGCDVGNNCVKSGAIYNCDDIPSTGCNNDNICQSTESCSCSDCEGKQDGCKPGLICVGSGDNARCGCNTQMDFFCNQDCKDKDPDCPTVESTPEQVKFKVDADNVVPITKIITYKGRPVKMNIVVWDTVKNE